MMNINHELIFKLLLIFEFCAFSIIRISYQRLSLKAGYRTVISESRRYAVYLAVFICYEVFTFFVYILWPVGFSWAQMDFPLWIRWCGAAVGFLSLVMFVWVHRTLGLNLSATLRIKEEQVLVINGPYRWVRHPMYTAFYLLHIGVLFLTANWFIGLTWMAGLALVIVSRVKREEAMLLSRFGADYRSYMYQTPRFIPWPFFRRTGSSQVR